MNDPDLLERNIDAIFAIVDTDGDGVVTSDDMTAMAAGVCERLHVTGSPDDLLERPCVNEDRRRERRASP
jgi:hypothetical protein